MGERTPGNSAAGRSRPKAATGAGSARKPAPPQLTGPALLESTLAASGLPAGPLLGRVGRRMRLATVRDLLFHLPRRYDDLR